MKRQSKTTKVNPSLNAYDKLADDDKLFVDMAVHGYLYSHIARKAKREHQTVKKWFSKRGRLHAAYQLRLAEYRSEYDEAFAQIDDMIKKGAVDAILKLIEAVRASGVWPTHIMAARDILDRAGFAPTQKIDASVDNKADENMKEQVDKIAKYVKSTITESNEANS